MHFPRCASTALLLLATLFSPTLLATDLHDADARYEAFLGSQRESYAAVNAEYEAAMLAAPDDIPLAIAHCDFILKFTYAEDISWNEDAEPDLESCQTAIDKKWSSAPEVRVYHLEKYEGDEALALGRKTWKDAGKWPASLRARVASQMQSLLEKEDTNEAGQFAVIAAELGDATQVAHAVTYLASKSEQARAIRLSQSRPPADTTWQEERRIEALGKLNDKTVARAELERSLAAGVEVSPDVSVKVYLAAGDVGAANRAAKGLPESGDKASAARFDLALANNHLAHAAALVSLDEGFDTWIDRYSRILAKAPLLAFGLDLLPLTLVLVFGMVVLVLMPGLLLVPVHYRGLVRRVNGRQPAPLFERIGLRHAWIAGGIILLVPMLADCIMRPDLIGTMFSDSEVLSARFELVAAGTILSLLALLPWLPGLIRTQALPAPSSFLRKVAVVVGCWLVVFTVGAVTAKFHQWAGSGDTSTLQTKTVEALVRNSWADYGVTCTFLLMAVAVPILEEAVFRGMLLGGLARHISFGWANTWQALLFATVHGDPPRFPFYLTIGLLGGWLVRRYGRLWPAIALHALNNAVATWLLM